MPSLHLPQFPHLYNGYKKVITQGLVWDCRSQWGLGRLRQEQLSCRGETKWQCSPTPSVTSANTLLGNQCQGPLPMLFELLSLP